MFILREFDMTESDKEMILDLLWEAMSIAASRDDIPVEAQIIADKIEAIISALLPLASQDNG
jgi:hypothetical protein